MEVGKHIGGLHPPMRFGHKTVSTLPKVLAKVRYIKNLVHQCCCFWCAGVSRFKEISYPTIDSGLADPPLDCRQTAIATVAVWIAVMGLIFREETISENSS